MAKEKFNSPPAPAVLISVISSPRNSLVPQRMLIGLFAVPPTRAISRKTCLPSSFHPLASHPPGIVITSPASKEKESRRNKEGKEEVELGGGPRVGGQVAKSRDFEAT